MSEEVAVDAHEPIKVLTSVTGGKDLKENELWEKEFERRTGIPLSLTKVAGNNYSVKATTTLAAGEDIDLIYMNSDSFQSLFYLHLFEPLDERIKNSDILGDPEVIPEEEWERLRCEDGKIYASYNKYEGGRLPLIRYDWLENLDLSVPTTLEEYEQVLNAFTYGDPDRNGKDDTLGLTSKNIYDIQPFMSSVGLVAGYKQDSKGDWYMPYATKEAIPVYNWLAKLYKQGVYDPNFVTNSSSNCREAVLTGRVGMFVYWDNWVGIFNQKAAASGNHDFVIRGILPPRSENIRPQLSKGLDGLWVMPSYSQRKDDAFTFMEFMLSYEGTILGTLGVEDYDYRIVNDMYELTDIGIEHAMDHGIVRPKSNKWKLPFDYPPYYVESRNIIVEYGVDEIIRPSSKVAKEIITKFAVKAIIGSISSEEAVEEMQRELSRRGFIK